jgi:hypothetical protein
LNTILQALPIAASTRDTIIARLSLDSASSSYSDRGRNGSGNDDEGHELDHVLRPGHKPRSMSEDGWSLNHEIDGSDRPSGSANWYNSTSQTRMSNRASGYAWGRVTWGVNTGTKLNKNNPGDADEIRRYTGSEDAASSTPLSVRTVQMEPSPAMQVPRRNSSTDRLLSSGDGFGRLDIRIDNAHIGKGKGKTRPKLSDAGFSFEGQDDSG